MDGKLGNIKAIGFDFYNTLLPYRLEWEYAAYVRRLAEEVSREFGPFLEEKITAANQRSIEVARQSIPPPHEMRMSERVAVFFSELTGRKPTLAEASRLTELFTATSVEVSHFSPYVPELLRRLTKKFKLGIVSNLINADTIPRILAREKVRELFEVVLMSAEFGYVKPHASIFKEFCRRMDVMPENVLFVGDDLHADIGGAGACGCKTLWVQEYAYVEGQPEVRPDWSLKSLAELESLLL